jgi:Rrf2 family protein
MPSVRVSARSDYALRAVAELAASDGRPMNRERIAEAQEIPAEFLENILLELKHVGIVMSQRGAGGGFRLARKASEISLADVIRAVDGPLANVRGNRPEVVEYRGSAAHLRDVWIAVRASLREILEEISVQDLVDGNLPARVSTLTKNPRAWVSLAFGPGSGSPRIRSPRTRNPRASAKSGGPRSA